jgi:hypothetical protein
MTHHEIAEILLKLALNTNQSLNQNLFYAIECSFMHVVGWVWKVTVSDCISKT